MNLKHLFTVVIITLLGTQISLAQISKTIHLEAAGTLSSALNSEEKNTITNLTITGNIDARDFKTMRDSIPNLETIDLSECTTSNNELPQEAFRDNRTISTVELPANLTSIGSFSFSGCYGISSITLPSSVVSIGAAAFVQCYYLIDITLNEGIQNIEEGAFYGCWRINEILLPSTVTAIGQNAFSGCSGLTSISIPQNTNTIGNRVFYGTSLSIAIFEGKAPENMGTNVFDALESSSFEIQYKQCKTGFSTPLWLGYPCFPESNCPPIANAGNDTTGFEDEQFTLHGSNSFDNDNQVLTYLWTAPTGITLSSTTVANPTFTAPEVDEDTNYTFTLVVNDGQDDSEADQVVITVQNIEQLTYVPDDNFEQALIDLGYDSGELDDYVPTNKINTITSLDVSRQNIEDLTGIEDFTLIEDLDCGVNNLTSLNTSQNTNLEELTCHVNLIASLDLSNNKKIRTLYCSNNNLKELDLSNNTELSWMYAYSNSLTQIIFPNTNRLGNLDISNNELTQLDISLLNNLNDLDCSRNNITSLDISNTSQLNTLNCNDNNLSHLNLRNGANPQLSDLLANNNPNLQCVEVDDVDYAETNWTRGDNWADNFDTNVSFSANCDFELSMLFTDGTNAILNAQLTFNGNDFPPDNDGNFNIGYIQPGSYLYSVSAVGFDPLLDEIFELTADQMGSSLKHVVTLQQSPQNQPPTANAGPDQTVNEKTTVTLDASASSDPDGNNLTYLWTAPTGITLSSTTVANPTFTAPEVDTDTDYTFTLVVNDGQENSEADEVTITVQNVEQTPMTYIPDDNFEQALIDLGYDSGDLDDYVPTENINTITDLNVREKNIEDLTGIEDFAALTDLNCFKNQLTTLNVSENIALRRLNCSLNQINALDLTNNTSLSDLQCSHNNLIQLDLSSLENLSLLYAYNNSLSQIILPNSTRLEEVTISGNQLTQVDVSALTNLKDFSCKGNNITRLDLSQNPNLEKFDCSSNQLSELNLQNGFNQKLKHENHYLAANYNPNLNCVQVDDVAYAESNWTRGDHWADNFDTDVFFSANCDFIFTMVVEYEGQRLLDAVVIINNQEYHPNSEGVFEIGCLEAGTYSYTVTATGFNPLTATLNLSPEQMPSSLEHEVQFTSEYINSIPIAHAGPDQTVNENTTVTLDASDSSDSDGDNITYQWTSPDGITLSSTTVANPTFTAPEVDTDTDYTFTLVVNDGQENSEADEVIITVQNVFKNAVPIANAGENIVLYEGEEGMLNGAGSYDPDGDPITFRWIAQSWKINLSSLTEAKPTFTAPQVEQDRVFGFFLEVCDSDTCADWHQTGVTVTVLNKVQVNNPPVAHAGPDQIVSAGKQLTLDGSASFDTDDDSLSFLWSIPSIIQTETLTNKTLSFETPLVTADTTLVITLTVNDGYASSKPDTVLLTIEKPTMQVVRLNVEQASELQVDAANTDYTILKGEKVQLGNDLNISGGSGSYQVSWQNNYWLSDSLTTQLNLHPNDTTYLQLIATDIKGCTASDFITINVVFPIEITGVVTDASYFGAQDGSIDLDIKNGAPPYSFMWSNDQTTANISNLLSGNYQLTVTDAMGQQAQKSFFVPQPDENGTSAETFTNPADFNLKIYPNPNQGLFTIEIEGIGNDILLLELFSVDGKSILKKQMNAQENKQAIKFGKENLIKGVYTLRIQNASKTINRKLIVK